MKPSTMKIDSPTSPPSSSCGAKPLKTAIAPAVTLSSMRRPKRSASMPEAMIATTPTAAPIDWMIRKRAGDCGVNRNTQDSGNTVTMWNSAKLASGAKAPMTMLRPSACTVSVDRRRLEIAALELPLIFRRDDDAQPREQRHHVDGEGDEEGVAPAPVEEIVGREIGDEISEQPARHHEAERRAELRDHRVPAALPLRRVHRQQRCQPVPGAAEREALPDAEQSEQYRRAGADVGVARQKRHGDGRAAEQEQRDGQLDAAAIGAVDRDENDSADRPRDEGEREDRERIERAAQRIDLGENQPRKHQHRGDRIDEEVEELRGAADDDADRDLARVKLVVAGIHSQIHSLDPVRPP